MDFVASRSSARLFNRFVAEVLNLFLRMHRMEALSRTLFGILMLSFLLVLPKEGQLTGPLG